MKQKKPWPSPCDKVNNNGGKVIYNKLKDHQVVGLLWADQNMRDFGDNHRLLMSSERLTLWGMLFNTDHQQFEDNIYFNSLDQRQANLDNIQSIL